MSQENIQVATQSFPKWVTVHPILNILGLVSVALLQEEGAHHYLSIGLFGYCLEIHFKGKLHFKSLE